METLELSVNLFFGNIKMITWRWTVNSIEPGQTARELNGIYACTETIVNTMQKYKNINTYK